jgi:hypothetical protein
MSWFKTDAVTVFAKRVTVTASDINFRFYKKGTRDLFAFHFVWRFRFIRGSLYILLMLCPRRVAKTSHVYYRDALILPKIT